MVSDMGDISAGHSPAAILTSKGEAVSEVTNHTPPPATTAAHTPIATCTMIHLMGIVATHPTLPHFSHRCHPCHYSTDQSHSHSRNACHVAQELQPRKAKPCPRPSSSHKPHCSKTVTIQHSPSDSSLDSDSYSDPLKY